MQRKIVGGRRNRTQDLSISTQLKPLNHHRKRFLYNLDLANTVSLAIISHPSDDELLCQLDVEFFDDFDVDIGVDVAAVDHEPPFQNHLAAGEPALGLNRCLEVEVNIVYFR